MKHEHVPVRAVLLICAATACFATLDAVIKALSARYPVPLLVWARWTIQALAIVAWLAPKSGARFLRTRLVRSHLLRGGVLIVSSVMFVYALADLPLANVTALSYAAPMMVVVLSVVLLDERVTPARIAFVVAGAIGMILVVRPGSEMFRGASLLALASAGCFALFQVLTRKMAEEDPGALLFYPAAVGALALAIPLAFTLESIAMPWADVMTLVSGGMAGTFGHFMLVLAFRRAPASALTPFTYMHLVWATMLGWAVFGTFPDGYALAGIAIIAGSGLLITLHERRRAPLRARRGSGGTTDDVESDARAGTPPRADPRIANLDGRIP